MIVEHNKLYKKDVKGKTRVWWIERDLDKYRTHSGILDGKIVTSGWKYPEEKNVGKKNATSIEEQTKLEVEALYEKQLYQGKYAETIEEANKGAKFVECMLAQKYNPKKHTKFPYWSSPKLDGVRALVSIDGIQTRQGKPLVSSPHIRDCLDDFFEEFPDVVLDGELYNHELKSDFEKIISLARKSKPTQNDLDQSAQMVEFHVYDVITPEPMPYHSRLYFLRDNVLDQFPMIRVVDSVSVDSVEEVADKLTEYLEDGYEGQMIRVDETPYEHKRSNSLLKDKTFDDAEFEIVNIVEGQGNWAGMAKSVEIRLENGETQHSGMRGTFDFAKQLLAEKDKYIGGEVTVRFQNRTAYGMLRMPIAVAFYENKRDV